MTVQRKRKGKMSFKKKKKKKKREIYEIRVVWVAASVNKGCHFTPVIVTPHKSVTESRTDLCMKMQTFFRSVFHRFVFSF